MVAGGTVFIPDRQRRGNRLRAQPLRALSYSITRIPYFSRLRRSSRRRRRSFRTDRGSTDGVEAWGGPPGGNDWWRSPAASAAAIPPRSTRRRRDRLHEHLATIRRIGGHRASYSILAAIRLDISPRPSATAQSAFAGYRRDARLGLKRRDLDLQRPPEPFYRPCGMGLRAAASESSEVYSQGSGGNDASAHYPRGAVKLRARAGRLDCLARRWPSEGSAQDDAAASNARQIRIFSVCGLRRMAGNCVPATLRRGHDTVAVREARRS